MYEIPEGPLNDLRLSRKSLKWLDFMASTQPTTEKPNFDALREKIAKCQM